MPSQALRWLGTTGTFVLLDDNTLPTLKPKSLRKRTSGVAEIADIAPLIAIRAEGTARQNFVLESNLSTGGHNNYRSTKCSGRRVSWSPHYWWSASNGLHQGTQQHCPLTRMMTMRWLEFRPRLIIGWNQAMVRQAFLNCAVISTVSHS